MNRLKKYHGEKAQWVLNAWTETWLSSQFRHWQLRDTITQIQCPLLVIHGELDEYGSSAQPQQFIDYATRTVQLGCVDTFRLKNSEVVKLNRQTQFYYSLCLVPC